MDSSEQRLKHLLEKYRQNQCSASDWTELQSILQVIWRQSSIVHIDNSGIDWHAMYGRVTGSEDAAGGHVVQMRTSRYWGWSVGAAAVVVGLLITLGLLMLPAKERNTKGSIAVKLPVVKDIAPGTDKAVLILANGKMVNLDTNTGNIETEQGTKVSNDRGALNYLDAATEPGIVSFHTVRTPFGGQYQLVLADGSRVWLNSGSSLRFPTSFPGAERSVELSGEGYFEVAHNADKPFHVRAGNMDVQVLGTSFNINAYHDEDATSTTLLEGSVKINASTAGTGPLILKPGQKAIMESNGQVTVENKVNTDAVISWKNGLFYFDKASVQAVMRQLARWYNVDIRYEGKVSKELFGGKMQRSLNLSQVMESLETSGIHYRLNGRTLTITE